MMPWPGLSGVVLDPERQPVERVRVRAINPGSGAVPEVTTDVAGGYAFERLAPGQYRFLAIPPAAGIAEGAMERT
ncbi:MAG: carboxypeptidase regulatory-like domain-containing protein [Acidimicrobiia bacterium]|nr:carboxypeptidase regulatory-like domain-containing protein [Acidimicrobiia bacterium]